MSLGAFNHLVKLVSASSLTALLLLTSCVDSGASKSKVASKSNKLTNPTGTGTGTGSGSLPNNTGLGDTGTLSSQKVELSHLVDPFKGTYTKKLTIPKNFKGNLYLAGINVASLHDKIVKVRFNFGLDRQSIVLGTTVARAPGIIPKTDIQVLVIDMNSSPFSNMRLGYDLYDYTDYSDVTKAPVVDPRDVGLYCRGLQLEDDPSFVALNQNSKCSSASDTCLYTYAKITDATLYTGDLTSIPTRPQTWSLVSGVRNPSIALSLASMCLPDSEDVSEIKTNLNALFDLSLSSQPTYDQIIAGYKYRGPYRAINATSWGIKSAAIFAPGKGLYEIDSGMPADATVNYPVTGLNSYLFPRSGKISLSQNMFYLGGILADDRFDRRVLQQGTSIGITNNVGGCNLRVMNYNSATTEGIGSCNVNASIEVFYEKDGREVNITTDKTIKLQLIRASKTNYEGKEVLASSFKACESSNTCGTDECCFNQRCWSKDLVTQCVDQLPILGNQPIGYNCSSDYECASLCCDQSRGACAPHDPNGVQPVSCSKSSGQQCISKEFCKPEFVPNCKVVKGPILNGKLTCTLRCPLVETFGECSAGVCKSPVTPPVPAFNPDDCSNAVDP